jgi:sodium transport system ATP-binding protein
MTELSASVLRKRFGPVQAVDGISVAVGAGEVVGLLGPNGAGKTTMLRILAGILTADSGSVTVNGAPMGRASLTAKKHVGFLSGDTQLYLRMSPREVLMYFGRLYEVPERALVERTEDLISELEMESFADRPCGALSSGQKQRANIARAFVHDPDVLILDEPTNALDVVSGRFITEAIRRKRAEGRAILFSTHIMGEAEYLCDRIHMIHNGRTLAEGSVPEILAATGTTNLTDAFFAAIGRERSSVQ